jgi:hypothetical protein
MIHCFRAQHIESKTFVVEGFAPAGDVGERNDVMSLQSSNEVTSKHTRVAGEAWEAEHQAVDRRLREYAKHRSALDAAEALDLVRAEQFKLYVLVGCSSHYDYMERVLGYGPHAARERM